MIRSSTLFYTYLAIFRYKIARERLGLAIGICNLIKNNCWDRCDTSNIGNAHIISGVKSEEYNTIPILLRRLN